MAQGEFTKEEADAIVEAVEEMFEGLTRLKQQDFVGHLNDIMLFLGAARRNAPEEAA